MITKRYPWKEEYAINGELFWKDLRENERKYAEEHKDLILDEKTIEPLSGVLLSSGPVNMSEELNEDDKRKRMLAFLGVKE